MGAFVDNLAKGGENPNGVRDVLQCGGVGSTSFGVVDVDDEPPHRTGHWRVQHRVAIWITGRYPLRFLDVSW